MFPSRESPPLKYTASFLFLSHTSQQQVDAVELGRIGGVDAAHRHAKQLQRERGGGEQHEVAHGRECEFGRRRQWNIDKNSSLEAVNVKYKLSVEMGETKNFGTGILTR